MQRAKARRALSASAIVSALAILGPATVHADQIVLTNGDTLTGTVASASGTGLAMDTALAGHVILKWSVISRLSSTTPVRAVLATGQIVEGTPILSDGRFSIQLVNGTSVPGDLATMRSIEVVRAPARSASWHGAVNAGVDLSRGNSETSTISTNGTGTRLGPRDRLGLYGTYLFSAIGSEGGSVTTARATRGGLRYDHDLAGRLFGFGFADVENDPLQLLDLRTVAGGGAGVHLLKTAASQLNVFGGVSYAKDSYTDVTTTTTTATESGGGAPFTPPGKGGTPPGQSGVKPNRGGTPPSVVRTSLSRSVAEYLIGQDWGHQLSDSVSLTEALTMYPAIEDVQDYRVSFDLSLSVQLNGWLQWNLNVADRYLNIPPSGGAIQNDTFISTGLGISWGRGTSGAYTGQSGQRPPPRR
jgi:hypothetical protein